MLFIDEDFERICQNIAHYIARHDRFSDVASGHDLIVRLKAFLADMQSGRIGKDDLGKDDMTMLARLALIGMLNINWHAIFLEMLDAKHHP